MHRVLIPPGTARDGPVTIRDPRTLHHLLRVLRVKPGERAECLDGRGGRYTGQVLRCTPREVIVQGAWVREEPRLRLSLTLAQALIKPDRFDWVIEKATELGVARVAPVISARTTVRLHAARLAPRMARWRRITEAAATQCGRAMLPVIESQLPFARAIKSLEGGPVLVLTLAGAPTPLSAALPRLRGVDQAAVMIGPEGDFTPEEVALAARAGGVAVRLGGATLRSETAAIAALAILQHAVGVL